MNQIWRPWDNFCAFETLSKMADLKKTPIFLLPYYTVKRDDASMVKQVKMCHEWHLKEILEYIISILYIQNPP
jgi:hypothetical protein